MVFLPHSCIPLAVSCKLSTRGDAEVKEDNVAKATQFSKVLRYLDHVINHDRDPDSFESWSADYKYVNLWSTEVDLGNIRKHNVDGARWILRFKTYWYKRLKTYNKMVVDKLLVTRQGRLHLKEILHYSDACISGMILGFPELLIHGDPYKVTDRWHNQIISNLLQDYTSFEVDLKRVRKYIRNCGFRKVPIDLPGFLGPGRARKFGFLIKPVKILNRLVGSNSRQKMYKLMCITQTRASGLASSRLCKKSIDKFIEMTSEPLDFCPNDLLIKSIDEVVQFTVRGEKIGSFHNSKVSMSTSACVENSKAKEGKFGYLKGYLKDIGYPPENLELIPKLPKPGQGFMVEDNESIGDDPEEIRDSLGNFLWEEAYFRSIFEPQEVKKYNLCTIREPGKARVVTSGSFWKDVLLQPFSHLTIELLKNNTIISDSFQAARHGWRFLERMEEDVDLSASVRRGRKEYVGYCSDWENATDAPSFASAKASMKPLLKAIGFSDSIIDVVINIWVSEKNVKVAGRKDQLHTVRNGVMMGDPLTKSNLSIAHAVAERYARAKCQLDGDFVPICGLAAGNGDDLVNINTNRNFHVYYEEAAIMLGYKPSSLDTFESTDWLFYCEEVLCIPQHGLHRVRASQKFRNIDLLPYLDYPRMRLLIDVSKDREDFSSSPIGKFTLLGREISWLPSKSVQYQYYQVASCIQDVALDTHSCPESHLPSRLFGVGKEVIGGNFESFKNFLRHTKVWFKKFIKEIIHEFMSSEWYFLNYRGTIVLGQKHFDNQAIIETYTVPDEHPIRDFIVIPKENIQMFPSGVIERLVTNGFLAYESGIHKYFLFNERLRQLSEEIRSNHDLFERIKVEVTQLPERNLPDEVVYDFLSTWRTSPYMMKKFIIEDVYDLEAIRELLASDPLMVHHFNGLVPSCFDRMNEEREPDSHVKKFSKRLYQWLREVIDINDYGLPIERHELISLGAEHAYRGQPTDLFEDDPIIVRDVCYSSSLVVAIITDDKRLWALCRNKALDRIILRIPCCDWVAIHRDPIERYRIFWEHQSPTTPFVDSGSILGYQEKVSQPESKNLDVSFTFKWSEPIPTSVPRGKGRFETGRNCAVEPDLVKRYGSPIDKMRFREFLRTNTLPILQRMSEPEPDIESFGLERGIRSLSYK